MIFINNPVEVSVYIDLNLSVDPSAGYEIADIKIEEIESKSVSILPKNSKNLPKDRLIGYNTVINPDID